MRVKRLPVDDEYAEGGRLAVLVGRDVTVLTPLPSMLLMALADGPRDVLWLVPRAVDRFGQPESGDARKLVERALRDLADLGLVTHEADLMPEFE